VSLGYTDSNGNAQTVTISYLIPATIQSNFGCSAISEYPATAYYLQVPTKISYPDGTTEQFTYEPTPGNASSTTGRIASITLRTGGTINFTYTGGSNGINCADATTAGLTIQTADGTWTLQHTPGTAGASTTTVIDPKGNKMVLSFQGGFETQRQIYQVNGANFVLLDTILTCYNSNKTNCAGITSTPKFPITELTVFQVLPNQQENEQDTFFDRNSQLQTELDEYDFGNNQPGALLRKTLIAYAALGNNITGKAQSVTVCSPPGTDAACNGATTSGTKVAQTIFGYDEGTLTATSNLPQHAAITGARGNLTSVHRWLNTTTGSTVNTSSTFDDAGRFLTTTDADNNTSSYGYACNDAYLSNVTRPATATNHVSSATYDCNTGLMLSATDENGKVTSFAYDAIMRPTQVTFADSGQMTISYPSANQVTTQRKIDSSRSTYSSTLFDGYGRKARTAVANGESTPYDQQDLCYDSNGLRGFTSYPYQGPTPVFSTAAVCSGSGGDTFSHDALGRITQVSHGDGSSRTTTYASRATQVTDEGNGGSSVSRILQTDALGRLANVCEIYSGSQLLGNGGVPGACNLDISGGGFLTSYGYDLLGNLTSVAQGMVGARSYAFDSLSRMTSATDPESGTRSYSYDSNGNVLTKTDARNTTTTYTYDALNRVTQRSFSDGTTPTAKFLYDTDPGWTNPSAPTTNVIGRLSEAYTTPFTAGEIFGYDGMGRVVTNNQCTPYNCGSANWPLSYTYDLLGDITSATNGVGVTFNYSYNVAGRLTGITSTANDAQHPPTLLSAAHYSPSTVTDTLGNNVVETTNFSPRGMLTSYLANAPNGTPGTGSVTISGSLQTYQQQTQAGTPAALTVTIGGSDSTIAVTTCVPNGHGGQTCTTTQGKDTGTISFTVTGGGVSVGPVRVSYNANSTTASLAAGLFSAFPSNSLVTMTYGQGNSYFTLTTIAIGSSANSTTFSSTVASGCRPPNCSGSPGWTVTPASANFSGGTDPVFQTQYDNGSTTITVNSHPDAYSWSGSGTTPASIAQGLCNAINGDTAAFATASTNGISGECPLGSATVSLASRQAGQNYTLSASSSSVVNSFSVACPGFSSCTSASLTGGGSPAYSFNLTPAPDGQITSANDLVNGNWAFTYDPFNRLLSSNKNSGQQTFTYAYDLAGNRWQQNAPQGGPAPQYMFDNNNHFNGSGISYDAAGNVKTDGLGNSFTWDGAGRMSQVNSGSTATYVYDAEGRRVRGPNGDYIYNLAGQMITQIGLNGVWNYGEIYAGNRHLATYSGSTTNFYHGDWLNTKRVLTGVNGAVSETCTGFYFGDGVNCTGTNWTFNSFTDDIHDPESNLEHTQFRQYSGTQGRWLSPDPYSGSMDLTDPQSLNRYTYVENNATNAFDPLGLYCPTYRVRGVFCLPGNLASGFTPDEWDNVPFPSGFVFDFGVDFGKIPMPSSVNCFAPGDCPNIPLRTLDQAIQAWLAGLPWNNPCIMSPVPDACGLVNGFSGPYLKPPYLANPDGKCKGGPDDPLCLKGVYGGGLAVQSCESHFKNAYTDTQEVLNITCKNANSAECRKSEQEVRSFNLKEVHPGQHDGVLYRVITSTYLDAGSTITSETLCITIPKMVPR
jgi:RHS repeat-associated protein